MTLPNPAATSPMSTSTKTTDHAVAGEESCTVCPHPWSAHDRLGVRFCTATEASLSTSPEAAASRGCICV